MAKAKFIMYINTAGLDENKAREAVEQARKDTKNLRDKKSDWAYIPTTDSSTRIETLYVG